jgi:hypothetical protein
MTAKPGRRSGTDWLPISGNVMTHGRSKVGLLPFSLGLDQFVRDHIPVLHDQVMSISIDLAHIVYAGVETSSSQKRRLARFNLACCTLNS